MIRLELRTVLHCQCIKCGHQWDSFQRDNRTGKLISKKPKRCAACKYLGWSGQDRRRKNPLEFVPADSMTITDGKLPQLHPKALLEAFTEAKNILEDVIRDLGPCDHSRKICVCTEQAALDKVTRQIGTLAKLTGRKGKNETTPSLQPEPETGVTAVTSS
jgi:hypothetical protein